MTFQLGQEEVFYDAPARMIAVLKCGWVGALYDRIDGMKERLEQSRKRTLGTARGAGQDMNEDPYHEELMDKPEKESESVEN